MSGRWTDVRRTRSLGTGRAGLIAFAVVAGGGLLTACGGDSGPTLTVYSGRHYGIESAFEQYEKDTGVNVEFLTGNDAELRERIAAEGDETEADVYLTVDAGNLAAAAEDGLFQPLHSEELRKVIPAQYREPLRAKPWNEVALAGRVFYVPVTVVGMGRRLLARRRDAEG